MKDYKISGLLATEANQLFALNQTNNMNVDVYPLKDEDSSKLVTVNNYFVDDWRMAISIRGKHSKARRHLAITYGKDGYDLLATDNNVKYYNLKAEYIEKFLKLDDEYHILSKSQRKDIEESLWLAQAFDKVDKGEFTITEVKL